MKYVLAAVAVLLAAACSNPVPALINSQGASHGCADTLMAQLVTTKSVKGSFECLSPAFQNTMHMYAISTDAELAQNVGVDGARLTYVGQAADGYVYVVDTNGSPTPYVVHLDKNGKVDSVH